MKTFRMLSVFGIAVALCLPAVFSAETPHGKLAIGKPAPVFSLKDTNGKMHSLSACRGKVVVLEFWSCRCPWVRGTEKDRNANVRKYAKKGVLFVSIDSNHSETPTMINKFLKEHKSIHPVLLDKGNKVADLYHAHQTPEVFIIDKAGNLAYHGAFDNRTRPNVSGTVNYIDDAVDALLAGKKVKKPETKAFGCMIDRVGD